MSCVPQNPCYTSSPLVTTFSCPGVNPCTTNLISSDYVGYSGPNLPCTNIQTCDSATVALQKADEKICQLKDQILILQQLIQNCCTTTTSTTTSVPPSTTSTTSTSSTSSTTSTTSSTSSTSSTTSTSTSSTSSTTSTTSSTSSTSSTTSTTSTTSSTSSTSSTTTTTTTIACTEFTALNSFISSTEVNWTDCCDLLPRTIILEPDNGTSFCSITVPTSPKATITIVGPCGPCTTTTTSSSTTSTTTTGYPVNVLMSDAPLDVCTGAPFNNLYIPQGNSFTTGTTLYQDPGCTNPFNITSYIYIVQNATGVRTSYGFNPLIGEILTSTGNTCTF